MVTSRTDKPLKAIVKEKESREKEWEAYEEQLVELRKKVNEMLNQTLKRL